MCLCNNYNYCILQLRLHSTWSLLLALLLLIPSLPYPLIPVHANTPPPCTQVILDGVCSVASEQILMDAWHIDVVVSASQKGLGAPPGLSIVVASQKAIATMQGRKTPAASYYASWGR